MERNLRGKVVGVGSPVVDLLAQVGDEFIGSIHGDKGGMELVSPEVMDEIVSRVESTIVRAAGGSAGNTIFALAHLGAACSFVGKLGKDEDGDYYQNCFRTISGDCSRFKFTLDRNTARCVSLITPDGERTMRTDLGAALLLSPDEISVEDFKGIYLAHIEGYLLFNPDLAQKVIRCAKEAGCLVSLDLGSFEVVAAAESMLHSLLSHYVDFVFANEDEAKAFCRHHDPIVALEELNKCCKYAAVKVGAAGAWVKERGCEPVHVKPRRVAEVLDTTGAGDYWAAGFLYGQLRGLPLAVCGEIGSILGAAVVQQIGAELPDEVWQETAQSVDSVLSKG